MTTDQLAIEQGKRIFKLEAKLAETVAELDHQRQSVRVLSERVDEKDGLIACLRSDPEPVDQRELKRLKAYNDDLAKEIMRLRADNHKLDEELRLYGELLMSVCRISPVETRHQTALRYIREAERMEAAGPSKTAESFPP
jgi:uncharacterized coiled-coil protein SlyX